MNAVSIVTIIAVFGMPVLMVWIIFYLKNKREISRSAVIIKALESGKEINANLFSAPKTSITTQLMIWGILLISIGLGAFLWIFLKESFADATVTFIVLFPGIGLLLAHFLLKK